MLKLKLQYFGHLMWRTDSLGKKPWCWERFKTVEEGDIKEWDDWMEKGSTEDEMVGWHHRLEGHEFELALGVGEWQGSPVCCSPWGCKESDMTELLNWTEIFSCPAPFVERTIFSVLHYLCSFLKFHSAVFTGVYFWTFCFVLLTYLHILSPIIACFDYYSFIMSLIFE